MSDTDTYRIVRFYERTTISSRTIRRGLTLEEAQAHCSDPEYSSKTATSKTAKERTRKHGPWFDGFYREVPRG